MTDHDQTTPEHRAEPAPESPPPARPDPTRTPPNGDGETAIAIALDERRRLLDFLEEMRREQAVERRQWFALIERLSGEQRAQQWLPLRVWHWLIADAPEPERSPSSDTKLTRRLFQRALRNSTANRRPKRSWPKLSWPPADPIGRGPPDST